MPFFYNLKKIAMLIVLYYYRHSIVFSYVTVILTLVRLQVEF